MNTSKHLMVVDDDPMIRGLLKRILERAGFSITACTSGQEALDRLPSSAPDMVLLDLCMPGMDGYQTLKALKEASPAVPVVMLSGYSSEDPEEMIGLGASGQLCKPVEMAQLLATVNRFIAPEEEKCVA